MKPPVMQKGLEMWRTLATVIFLAPSSLASSYNVSIFKKDLVIFSSTSNITKLLVQVDVEKIRAESDLPSVFFTLMDARFEGGSCIYVLEDLTAYEILEGGRDSTVDYGSDRNVYFGSKDGVYRYDRETLSAKKLGPYKDDIIQLQKANGMDKIYFLTWDHKLFELENHGRIRNRLETVVCASQFVLDTSNNLYYVQCKTQFLFSLRHHSSVPIQVDEEFLDIRLIRPAFIMHDCIPLLGDGTLNILYSNGTCDLKNFYLAERPSAISVDTGLYIVVALNGKIYEYDVMDVLLKSIYGVGDPWPQDVNKIIVAVLGSSKDIFGAYKGYII